MKVLFVNLPGYCYTDTFRDSINPPLNLAYLISSLNRTNIESDVLDLFLESINKYGINLNNKLVRSTLNNNPDKDFMLFLKKKLLNKLSQDEYLMVAVNGDLFQQAFFIFRETKNFNPNIFTVSGGNYPTFNPGSFLDKEYIDYICLYEAETSLKDLAITLLNKEDISKVKGIYYKKQGSYIRTELPALEEISKINPPDYSKFDMINYLKLNKNRLIALTARGCRANCNFCGIAKISRRIRIRDSKEFVNEIIELNRNYKSDRFTFYNAMMNLTPKHISDICNEIINSGLKIKWSCFIRADFFIDIDILKLMKKSGCELISFGIETASQKVSNFSNKNISLPFAKKIIKYCKKEGIIARCSFMYGLPKENLFDFLKTVIYIFSIRPDIITFNKFSYDPGSYFYNNIEKFNDVYIESFLYLEDYTKDSLMFKIKEKIRNLTLNLINEKKISFLENDN